MLFMTLFAAHLLGDFVFQSTEVATKKSWINEEMMRHILIHLVITSCAVAIYQFSVRSGIPGIEAVSVVIVLSILHWIVDILKVQLDAMSKNRIHYFSLFTFVVDQIVHISFILIALFYLKSLTPTGFISTLYALIKADKITLTPIGHVLGLAILLFMGTRFSGFLVGKLVGPQPKRGFVETEKKLVLTTKFPPEQSATTAKSEVLYMHMDDPEPQRGALIGYLERLIVMFLVYGQAYAAIAFIATAKSLVRFKQMDHREWAEYFLVGTLSSMLLGLIAGHIMRSLI